MGRNRWTAARAMGSPWRGFRLWIQAVRGGPDDRDPKNTIHLESRFPKPCWGEALRP